MNLAGVMDGLGAALSTIDGLRVTPYWADRVTPPAAVVAWPDPLTFDSTMGRGSDRQEFPVIVVVGRVDARSTRDALAVYAAGSGDLSVKQAIEGYASDAYDSARVDRAEFASITISGVDYMAATFYVDVIGQGA
jgi:hypothetical protein